MITSKLGILCLIATIALMALIDLRVLLLSGFLYYAYKLLYKNEKPNRLDKILIISLFILLLLEIFTIIYFANSYMDAAAASSEALV